MPYDCFIFGTVFDMILLQDIAKRQNTKLNKTRHRNG